MHYCNKFFLLILLVLLPTVAFSQSCTKWNPGNYVFIPWVEKRSKNNIEKIIASLGNEIVGVRGVMSWRMLEPQKDKYDFSQIKEQIQICKKYNKRFLLLVVTRLFNSADRPIPDYLYDDPLYNGGAEPFAPKRGSKGTSIGSMARIWDPVVLHRFNKLIAELGKQFDADPCFEGIIFGETACQVSPSSYGLSEEAYLAGLKSILSTAKSSFPSSNVFQMVNWGSRDLLTKLIEHCYQIGAGISCPDLMPDTERFSHINRPPGYDFFSLYSGKIPLSIEAQAEQFKGTDGNLTPGGMYDMAINTLKVNYMIWGVFEVPQYKLSFNKDIKPFLKQQSQKLNAKCPEKISPCCP